MRRSRVSGVARPEGKAATSFREARVFARELGFPVLVRPIVRAGRPRRWRSFITKANSRRTPSRAPPILPGAPLLVDKYLRGLEVEVDAVFDGEDILDSRHLRTHRTRRHSLRRFDQRLSDANDRRGDGDAHRRRHDRDRARTRHSRPDQHSIRDPRRRALHHRGQSAREPHRADHLRRRPASISSPRRRASRSARQLRDMPYGIGLHPRPPYVVVKVPVFSFSKMRGVETILGPGDEIDRRSARHRRHVCRRVAQGVHRRRHPLARRAAAASSSRSRMKRSPNRSPVLRRYVASRPHARRDAAARARARSGRHRVRSDQQDRRWFAARARRDRDARRRSGDQRCQGPARNRPITTRFAAPRSKRVSRV